MIVLGLVLGLAIVLVLGVDRHGVCWVQDGAWHRQVCVSVIVGMSARVSASVSVNDSARVSVGFSDSASVRG